MNLTKRMKYLQTLKEHYWVRFNKEYLTSLRKFHKQGIDPKRTIEVGEIVIVHAENKRLHRRLGKVTSLLPSKDGVVRAAVVKVLSRGINKTNYIKRPIEKLYPLEIKSIENVDNSEINESKMQMMQTLKMMTSTKHYLGETLRTMVYLYVGLWDKCKQ